MRRKIEEHKTMIHFLVGVAIGIVLWQFRYGFTLWWALWIVAFSFNGSLAVIPAMVLFVCEFTSAVVGQPALMIVNDLLYKLPEQR